MSQTVISYRNNDFEAEIATHDGRFELRWGDYVANEWVEPFAELPLAVARLAVLIDAVGHDEGFREQPNEFAREASRWLTARTTA